MQVFGIVVISIGVLLIVGFLVYEIFSLVRDIKKAIKKKKDKELKETNNEN